MHAYHTPKKQEGDYGTGVPGGCLRTKLVYQHQKGCRGYALQLQYAFASRARYPSSDTHQHVAANVGMLAGVGQGVCVHGRSQQACTISSSTPTLAAVVEPVDYEEFLHCLPCRRQPLLIKRVFIGEPAGRAKKKNTRPGLKTS